MADGLVGKTISYDQSSTPVSDRSRGAAAGGSCGSWGRLTDGGRTLSLATDPHPRMARYVLPLLPPKSDKGAKSTVATRTAYDLGGVEVTWSPEGDPDERSRWSGWWPLLDPEATGRLTQGSRPHVDGMALLTKPGQLVLNTLLRLPRGEMAVSIETNQPILEAALGEVQAEPTGTAVPAITDRVVFNVASEGLPLFLTITCRTGGNAQPFRLKATYRATSEKSDHRFERDALSLPVGAFPFAGDRSPLVVPDLSGGELDAARQSLMANRPAGAVPCLPRAGGQNRARPDRGCKEGSSRNLSRDRRTECVD